MKKRYKEILRKLENKVFLAPTSQEALTATQALINFQNYLDRIYDFE
jgi:hypothetical protein